MRTQLTLGVSPGVAFKPRRARSVPVSQDTAVASQTLLRGAREVLIRHGGEVYRLRHTRNDKLILTK
jgi:hemin uptake protein HemP